MKNLLENLSEIGTEMTSELLDSHTSLNFSITAIISKGNLRQEFNAWGDTEKSRYKGYFNINVEDFELNRTTIGGLVIDNIGTFIKTLNESGLSTIAKSLVISNDEIRNQLEMVALEDAEIKTNFNGLKCYNFLTDKEKVVLRLKEGNITKNTYFTKQEKELVQDLLDLEEITEKDIKAKIKELS